MADLEKVIRGWERCRKCHDVPMLFSESYRDCEYTRGMYCRQDILIEDTLALLKEQDTCENCAIAIEDRQPVVRCKDCKHRPKEPDWKTYESGFDLEFPEGSKCPCRCSGDKWYSWYPEDDWFCADGERQEGR